MLEAHRRLRDSTECIHNQLHEHPAFLALFAGTISVNCYKDLMTRFYGFYAPLDSIILEAARSHSCAGQSFDYEPRAPYFASDLAEMGLRDDDLNTVSVCTDLPSVLSSSELAGLVYVVEGSLLGGATMNRAIDKSPLASAGVGRSYWEWCERAGKQRWKATLRFMSEIELEEERICRMADTAQATFQSLVRWLEPVGRELPVAAID